MYYVGASSYGSYGLQYPTGPLFNEKISHFPPNGHGQNCTGVTIEKIWWQCVGMKTRLFFDATSNAFIIELGENQSGFHDYTSFGGLKNNAGSGVTGDILFTTVGHSSGDTYTITLEMRKNYD